MSLHSLTTETHVTALHVNSPYLFIGHGDRLLIRNVYTSVESYEKKAFNSCIIHNINSTKIDDSDKLYLSLNANRYIAVVSWDGVSAEQALPPTNLKDWVMETVIRGEKVFCILAHNAVAVYDWRRQEMLWKRFCPIKQLLYSQFVLDVVHEDKVVVAVGTAFKELIVWQAVKSDANVLQTIRKHDGVIFAINYNSNNNVLASASDDRSVHLYSFISAGQSEEEPFFLNAQRGVFTLNHVLYGHGARIWKVITLTEYLISVGENSNLCVWSINEGRLVYKEANGTSSIWSLAADQLGERFFYGSSDGSVKMRQLEDVLRETVKHSSTVTKAVPKVVLFSKFDSKLQLIVVRSDGKLTISQLEDEQLKLIQTVNLGPDFVSYSTACVHNESRSIFCGNKSGKIAKIDVYSNHISSFVAHANKICAMFFVSDEILLSSSVDGEVCLWKSSTLVRKHVMPPAKQRWATCGVLVNSAFLILGDRSGCVTAFAEDLAPQTVFHNIHDDNGVTDIKRDCDFIYSSGRDGHVVQYFYNQTANSVAALRVILLSCDMDWLGKLSLVNSRINIVAGFMSSDFVVWSETTENILWKVTCGGGHRLWDFVQHDNKLHLAFTHKNEILHYSTKIASSTASLLVNPSVKPGYNASRTNCAVAFGSSDTEIYFAVAGDDCTVAICSYCMSSCLMKMEAQLFAHLSTIKAIANYTSNNINFLVTVGARSQLVIWRWFFSSGKPVFEQSVNHFLWNTDGPQRKPWRGKYRPVDDPQVRYMDVRIKELTNGSFLLCVSCSDARVRLFILKFEPNVVQLIDSVKLGDYCCLSLELPGNLCVSGSNDGSIRVWTIDYDKVESFCGHIQCPEKNIRKPLESINGLVSKFGMLEVCCSSRNLIEERIHGSGVNVVKFRALSSERWLLFSGGDDSSVTVGLWKESATSAHLYDLFRDLAAHSSSVTGLLLLGEDMFVTCSTDQRVQIWKYSYDLEQMQVKVIKLGTLLTCVADVAGLCCLNVKGSTASIAVYGEGFELYEISLKTHRASNPRHSSYL